MTAIDTHKQIVTREIEALWNNHELTTIDELYSADSVLQYPGQPPIRGRDQLRQFVEMYLSAFPDLSMTIDDMIAEGDRVACRYTQQGTHEGRLLGLAPTHNRIQITGIAIRRFEDRAVAELWLNDDSVGLLRQLGVFPRLRQPQQTGPNTQA